LGGGSRIINQTWHCVKKYKLLVRQFQYNLICSRLGKEARYAGFGWRSDGAGQDEFPKPKPRCLHASDGFFKGGKATPLSPLCTDGASLIPDSSPTPRQWI